MKGISEVNLRAETGLGLYRAWLMGIHNVRGSLGFSWIAGLAWNHGLCNMR